MKRIIQDYGLSLTLFLLFSLSWGAQAYYQWQAFTQEQGEHQQQADVSSFMPEFLSATFENWQSEFLQLLTMVVLTSFLIHKGSAESRDSDDEMKSQLSRIEKLLKAKKT